MSVSRSIERWLTEVEDAPRPPPRVAGKIPAKPCRVRRSRLGRRGASLDSTSPRQPLRPSLLLASTLIVLDLHIL